MPSMYNHQEIPEMEYKPSEIMQTSDKVSQRRLSYINKLKEVSDQINQNKYVDKQLKFAII